LDETPILNEYQIYPGKISEVALQIIISIIKAGKV